MAGAAGGGRQIGEVKATLILFFVTFYCCFTDESFHQADSYWRKSHLMNIFENTFFEVTPPICCAQGH